MILSILSAICRLTWELPQTLVGFFYFLFVSATDKSATAAAYRGCISVGTSGTGVSLGLFIFYPRASVYDSYGYPFPAFESNRTQDHEYGHSIQSRILGPLYIPLVGIPSLFFNLLTRMRILKREDYYFRYPENWADDLGGVHRL